MKKFIAPVLALLVVALAACTTAGQTEEKLLESFKNLPDTQRVAVYWYWISDNISVEGVEHDLEAMKEAGIGRAYIGNIWQDDVAAGPTKVLSDGWWEVVHAALKKATELDIEIGMFNCPGWSQSGGPWIKPQQAMRYLASSRLDVEGNGTQQTLTLPPLPADAKDERVIAMPNLDGTFDTQAIEIVKDGTATVGGTIDFAQPTTVRSLTFTPSAQLIADATVEAKVDDSYQQIATVHLDRTNLNPNVGFLPLAPITAALPETTTQSLRVTLLGGDSHCTVQVTASSEPRVERYAEKSLAKMFQQPLPMWDEYMWRQPDSIGNDVKVVQPDEVTDITSFVADDGTLKWEVPEGKWTILRTGLAPTGVVNSPASPEATGLEVDKMSRKHVADHFDAFIGEILRRVPAADRKTFRIVVEDSYETGGQNWTDDMIPSFKERYGYDPTPFIPTLYGQVVGSPDLSERFLWDLRRFVADRVAYDYVGGLREVSNKNGLTTWLECYGHWGFPGEFLMYGGQSDEVGGEFWSEGTLGDIENRAASSCAHIYGKQKVWAESCTAGGPQFHRSPYMMKARTDRFFTEGINATLLHVYIQQPDDTTLPGISADFGNEFNRKNTWFSQLDLFTDYLRRCNFLLQQGHYVADVAYFIGEDAPKMTGATTPELPRGYSFDYINAEVLKQAKVKDHSLVLKSGMRYNVLVLPDQTTMRPEVLECISKLVKDGLTIVGPQPTRSPSMEDYPKADTKVRELAGAMWEQSDYGKGKVYPAGTSLTEVLQAKGIVPDFETAPEQPVLFIHRQLDNLDIYFVSNQCDSTINISPKFRTEGTMPELWDAVTGDNRRLPQFESSNGQTTVPLRLEGYQSMFVVFKKADPAQLAALSEKENFPAPTTLKAIDTPWTLTFQPDRRGPEKPITLNTLASLTESNLPEVKYFAGNITYETTFDLDNLSEAPVWLELGNVMVMARVYINNEYAGGVWTPPYRVYASNLLKKGSNTLRIEVVNNWQNRLIGDQQLPVDQRKTFATINPYNKDSELQPSGLLGPVSLEIEY